LPRDLLSLELERRRFAGDPTEGLNENIVVPLWMTAADNDRVFGLGSGSEFVQLREVRVTVVERSRDDCAWPSSPAPGGSGAFLGAEVTDRDERAELAEGIVGHGSLLHQWPPTRGSCGPTYRE
jgi:hypothetical protein